MPWIKQFYTLIFVVLLTGCNFFKPTEYTGPELTEQGYYFAAQEDITSEDYGSAINKLQQLESRYPFGRYAEQAQLDLIFAYYQHLESEAAHATAERFIRLHPNHPNADYAYYMRGLASYSEGKGLIERFVNLDYSKRDPGAARRSFSEFSQLLSRFPASEYIPDARARMIYLRNLLARYEINVANYYIKRQAYVAAVNRGRYVIENFQETPSVADGLAIMVESYTHLGMHDLAATSLNTLKLSYPNHTSLDSGQFEMQREPRNADRSWINILTFGLFG